MDIQIYNTLIHTNILARMVNRRGDCGWQDAGAWASLAKRGPFQGLGVLQKGPIPVEHQTKRRPSKWNRRMRHRGSTNKGG